MWIREAGLGADLGISLVAPGVGQRYEKGEGRGGRSTLYRSAAIFFSEDSKEYQYLRVLWTPRWTPILG